MNPKYPQLTLISILFFSVIYIYGQDGVEHSGELSQFLNLSSYNKTIETEKIDNFEITDKELPLISSARTITESGDITDKSEDFFAKTNERMLKAAKNATTDYEKRIGDTDGTAEELKRYGLATATCTSMFLFSLIGLFIVKVAKKLELSALSIISFSAAIGIISGFFVLYA